MGEELPIDSGEVSQKAGHPAEPQNVGSSSHPPVTASEDSIKDLVAAARKERTKLIGRPFKQATWDEVQRLMTKAQQEWAKLPQSSSTPQPAWTPTEDIFLQGQHARHQARLARAALQAGKYSEAAWTMNKAQDICRAAPGMKGMPDFKPEEWTEIRKRIPKAQPRPSNTPFQLG